LSGLAAAIAYIEADQGLLPGTLSYLNSFDANTGFENNGAVDSSHFTATLIDGERDANVSWSLATSGFQLGYVFVKDGRNATSGPYLYHLYGVTPDEVFNSNGEQFVTVNGQRFITYIAFFGMSENAVPDGGATLILLGLSMGAVALLRRTHFRSSEIS
jgi:hypothetical protein